MKKHHDLSHLAAGTILWAVSPSLNDFHGNVTANIIEYIVIDPPDDWGNNEPLVRWSKAEAGSGTGLYCEEYFLTENDAKIFAAKRLAELLAGLSVDVSELITVLLSGSNVVSH